MSELQDQDQILLVWTDLYKQVSECLLQKNDAGCCPSHWRTADCTSVLMQISAHPANFLHQTCIASLVKHLTPCTRRISEWMAFEQSPFVHRKRITEYHAASRVVKYALRHQSQQNLVTLCLKQCLSQLGNNTHIVWELTRVKYSRSTCCFYMSSKLQANFN